MGITSQLYQLQETDQEIESAEQALEQNTRQLGDRKVLDDAQGRLAAGQAQLDELRHRHRDAEAEVDDVLAKIATAEEQLYSGRITNPKELSSLQHEVTTLRGRSDELETKALEIIEQVEAAEKVVAEATGALKKLEEEWQQKQQQLAADIDRLKASLAELNGKRRQLVGQIDPPSVNLYERVRQNKKPAVARVEQGICRVCRISLSASEVQRVRSGNPIQCGSCGRILFLP
jgi:predicted  nucleic acid-binding Zn-ribbon protein